MWMVNQPGLIYQKKNNNINDLKMVQHHLKVAGAANMSVDFFPHNMLGNVALPRVCQMAGVT